MVDLRDMSNSAASSAEKIPGQIPMMHTVRGGLRALPANFGIFRGAGVKGGIPVQGFFSFRGRDVGAVTPAASLAEKNAGMCAGMPSGVTTPFRVCMVSL